MLGEMVQVRCPRCDWRGELPAGVKLQECAFCGKVAPLTLAQGVPA
jgi:phage FluMu protein Com